MIRQQRRRVASYVRCSSDKQEQSPDQQREQIATLIEREGYELVAEFADVGISGDDESRPGYRALLAAATAGDFDGVVIWNQDRLTRATIFAASVTFLQLQAAGVFVHSVCDGLLELDTPTGQLMIAAKQMTKSQFLVDLSKNIKRGRDKSAKAGIWSGGDPPFGYAVQDGLLAPDPDTAAIVKTLFEMYASGNSIGELLDYVEARTAKRWTRSGLRNVMKNRVYLGEKITGKIRMEGKKRVAVPREEWRVILASHAPIIDAELFARVQATMSKRRRFNGPQKSNPAFAMTGMVRCPVCDSTMQGWTYRGERQYVCGSYVNGQGCDRYFVRERELLTNVLDHVSEFFEANRATICEAIRVETLKQHADANSGAGRLAKSLQSAKGKLSRAESRLLEVPSDLVSIVVTEVRRLQDEVARLEQQHADASVDPSEHVGQLFARYMEAFCRLRYARTDLIDAEPAKLRAALCEFGLSVVPEIQRVHIGGRKHRCNLVGGAINLSWPGITPAVASCLFTELESPRLP